MPKKESVVRAIQDSDSDDSSDAPVNNGGIREVNRANILNYQSDSSDE